MVIQLELPGVLISDSESVLDALARNLDIVDLILLDNKLGIISGLDGIGALKRKWPMARIVVLSGIDNPLDVQLALDHGADGFISKSEKKENIIQQIELALKSDGGMRVKRPAEKLPALTKRQLEVLTLLSQGFSNKLIAKELSLSVNTVRRHVQDILLIFGVSSRAEAVFLSRSTNNN